jgi:hypothetical protein
MVNKPGLFAAGYASSAVVETILDFWQYFEPERLFMPANCSADIEKVIAHIDQVYLFSFLTKYWAHDCVGLHWVRPERHPGY